MTTEIGMAKPRATDFTVNGKAVSVRKLPLSLGLRLQSVEGEIPPEIIAEVIAQCVVDGKGKPIFTVETVLNHDLEPMLKLFYEVTSSVAKGEDAEKN